jgi:predicted Holliday junction resolvase-like endonuclease
MNLADPNPERLVLTAVVLLALALALVVRFLATRVLRGCPECGHCVLENQRRQEAEIRRRREEARRNLRWLGVTDEEIERHIRDLDDHP